jgi:uncharacterized protein (DUF362 family)
MTGCKREREWLLTRREAIGLGAAATAAGALGMGGGPARAAESATVSARTPVAGPGRVVEVHKPGSIGRHYPHGEAAREMVERAVEELSGESDPGRAWGRFVTPEDRVGIKINCLGGRWASTRKEVVDPIVEGVRAAGVPDENIMIYDQFGGNMRVARYEWQDKPGKLRVINHAVLGYDNDYTVVEGARGKLAKTLLWTTAVINVPLLKDHDLVSITCAMKNMVFGNVEKPQLMHREIQVGMPHFYALDAIRSRVRLNVIDGTFCLYEGGPKHNPSTTDRYERVYATCDPVAADAIALEVVEAHRARHKLRPLPKCGRPADYLRLAEELGLGIADRDRIDLEKIELEPFEPEPEEEKS